MQLAVTGIGVVSAIGIGKDATLHALELSRSGVGKMRYLHSAHIELPVGEVDLPSCTDLPRSTQLGILAAREALEDAGILPNLQGTHYANTRSIYNIAFVSGTTVGGMDLTEQHLTEWLDGVTPTTILQHDTGSCTRDIATELGVTFSLMATPSTACSSASNALIMGCNLLRTGRADQVLVGGTECLTRFHLNGFHSLMILDSKTCRPFDINRKGLNLGEGAAYLLIEDAQKAHARGAHIYGYVAGYGNASDAFHQTASSNDGEGAYRAMKQAISMAGVSPDKIDYVNAHGTGTPNNDASELVALQRIFGSHLPYFSSTKSLTGHTTSASGSIELAFCLLCMQAGFAPAGSTSLTPMDDTMVPILHNTPSSMNFVLSNAFGFGGNDSSVLLSRLPINLTSCVEHSAPSVVADVKAASDCDYKAFLTPMQARRLTPMMRQIVYAARTAMNEAQVVEPEAIITVTRWGCIVNSVRFLMDMYHNQEQGLQPTSFIQSTHNTIGSLLGILTHNHGYNVTYSQSDNALDVAFLDVTMQMELGLIRSALVLVAEEADSQWNEWLSRISSSLVVCPVSRAIVLKSTQCP